MSFLSLTRFSLICTLTIGFTACGSEPVSSSPDFLASRAESSNSIEVKRLIESILLFVNHESTTVSLLDNLVELDWRAAAGIILHRNGRDEILGTQDDNLFNSIDEIDSIAWVGSEAIQLLREYVIQNGWVSLNDNLLGVFDGVSFTVSESEDVLSLVNALSLEQLDELLDRRAVEIIVTQRPFVSIRALSAVKWLGPHGLTSLKIAVKG